MELNHQHRSFFSDCLLSELIVVRPCIAETFGIVASIHRRPLTRNDWSTQPGAGWGSCSGFVVDQGPGRIDGCEYAVLQECPGLADDEGRGGWYRKINPPLILCLPLFCLICISYFGCGSYPVLRNKIGGAGRAFDAKGQQIISGASQFVFGSNFFYIPESFRVLIQMYGVFF